MMKILWICNVELPIISRIRKVREGCFGGWLDQMSEQLSKNDELIILYRSDISVSGQQDKLKFFSFTESNIKALLNEIIVKEKPDIIHLWGTEFEHSFYCIETIKDNGFLDNCVVSIQGLVSVIEKHYIDGLPNYIVNYFTLRDIIKLNNIKYARKKMKKRGVYEEKTLRIAKNAIGRTDWDRACITRINPNINYYFCNETLRKSFYSKRWDINRIEKHSIFVSQCSYPIKGFHQILMAMPDILIKYPDAKIYTTGKDLLNLKFKDKILLTSYQKYILKLIKKYRLENNIVFLGTLNENDMAERYKKSHVFVNPSSIENSSNSICEAMMIGCPVVASFVGGTVNLINHGTEGFLYQFSAEYMIAYYINKIFSSDELALALSKNGHIKASSINDIQNNYISLINIYNKITLL